MFYHITFKSYENFLIDALLLENPKYRVSVDSKILMTAISYILLANTANTNCHPLQVKITYSESIIDELHQRCYMT